MFSFAINLSGVVCKSYVFKTEDEVVNWLKDDFKKIQSSNNNGVTLNIKKLDELNVGDTCFVAGKGTDEFKIDEVKKIDENEYCFVINGSVESIGKCFKQWRVDDLPKSLIEKVQKEDFNYKIQPNYIVIEPN